MTGDEEISEADVQVMFDKLTTAFEDHAPEVCLAGMCHKIAVIPAYLTDHDAEAAEALAAFANDVFRRVPSYRQQAAADRRLDITVGTA